MTPIYAVLRRAFRPAPHATSRRAVNTAAQPAPPAPALDGAGTIDTPEDALVAVVLACNLVYGATEGPRVFRLSGLRVGPDWSPQTAHELLLERAMPGIGVAR